MYCPHCGKSIPDSATFCGHCGKSITRAPQNPGPAPQRTRRVVRLLAVAVAVLLLAGVGVTAWLTHGFGLFDGGIKKIERMDTLVRSSLTPEAMSAASQDQQVALVQQTLDEAYAQGLIQDGYYFDPEVQMYNFVYANGAIGGVDLRVYDDESFNGGAAIGTVAVVPAVLAPDAALIPQAQALNADGIRPNMLVLDAFGSKRDSTYDTYKQYWEGLGFEVILDKDVTVDDFTRFPVYDVVLISMHGTMCHRHPALCLRQESSGDLDKKYKKELDEQRIARIYCNGYFAAPRYYVLPAFFGERSSSGSLDGTMVFSESCDFLGSHDIIGWFTGDQALGGDRDLKTEFPDAMLGAGAKSVQGFVNSVSASYCISLITYELYDLRDGFMLYQALTFAQEHYGSDDSQYHDTDWPARAFAYGDTDASLGRPVPGTKLQNGTVVYAGTIEVVTVSKRLEEVGAGDSGYTIFGPTALDHEYAILVLDEPAKATGWSYGPYADITRDVSSICLGNDWGSLTSVDLWREFDGKHVYIALGDGSFPSDVSGILYDVYMGKGIIMRVID
ncbi:MAG: zinc ribbon domain-containing protein [Coriobacteriales bacterium]|nr:zinc ribbon domain-containing protein [Coriobacteriales bacterium]MBQ6585636.1 zinc ribbon domain-containing protein [Coriobacteriales bacterium]